jgi:hypothetical protein
MVQVARMKEVMGSEPAAKDASYLIQEVNSALAFSNVAVK